MPKKKKTITVSAEVNTSAGLPSDSTFVATLALPEPLAERRLTKETALSAEQADLAKEGKWYVIHTYSGHENKVVAALKQKIESLHLEHKIFDFLVPTQEKIKISEGKKEEVREKIFPGYILVKMLLDDESWTTMRSTPGITGFVGLGNKPTALPQREIEAIQKFIKMPAPKYKAVFENGEAVKIVDGPFAEFIGKIDNVDEEKGRVKVLVSIFGRETPVELDFLQVAKL